MSACKARTEAAVTSAAPVDSEEKDVKIPVEAVDDTEANEAPAAEAAENQVEDSNKEATMTELPLRNPVRHGLLKFSASLSFPF